MKPNADDIQSLRLLGKDPQAAVPPFNVSRLIAMQLVERRANTLGVTEKGRSLLEGRS